MSKVEEKNTNDDIKSNLSVQSVQSNQIDNSLPSENGPKLKWNDQTEQILVQWADNSICLKWLHDRSFRKYRYLNYVYTLPVIILSTLTGTLNVGINAIIPKDYVNLAQILIGALHIIAGILTTLLNFFSNKIYCKLFPANLPARVRSEYS